MRPARITPLSLLRAAAVVTVAFSLLTSFPALHYRVELFAHFRLQYLAASVLLLLVFAGLRHSVFGVILLAAASLNAAHVVPWYLGEPAPPTAATLKLLNANVLSHNDDYEALIRLVETEQPDIIFLQEISPAWQAHLAPLGNRYPHGYTEPRSDNFGIALLSRLPLESGDRDGEGSDVQRIVKVGRIPDAEEEEEVVEHHRRQEAEVEAVGDLTVSHLRVERLGRDHRQR